LTFELAILRHARTRAGDCHVGSIARGVETPILRVADVARRVRRAPSETSSRPASSPNAGPSSTSLHCGVPPARSPHADQRPALVPRRVVAPPADRRLLAHGASQASGNRSTCRPAQTHCGSACCGARQSAAAMMASRPTDLVVLRAHQVDSHLEVDLERTANPEERMRESAVLPEARGREVPANVHNDALHAV